MATTAQKRSQQQPMSERLARGLQPFRVIQIDGRIELPIFPQTGKTFTIESLGAFSSQGEAAMFAEGYATARDANGGSDTVVIVKIDRLDQTMKVIEVLE